jgi:hypothetical protein
VCVRLVDLDHLDPCGSQLAGQLGAVRAGALDSDLLDTSEPAHPGQHFPDALVGGDELVDREQTAAAVEDSGLMGVGMGVDPANDNARPAAHRRTCRPFFGSSDRVPGRADTTAMAQLFSGRFLSGHIRPDRSPLDVMAWRRPQPTRRHKDTKPVSYVLGQVLGGTTAIFAATSTAPSTNTDRSSTCSSRPTATGDAARRFFRRALATLLVERAEHQCPLTPPQSKSAL